VMNRLIWWDWISHFCRECGICRWCHDISGSNPSSGVQWVSPGQAVVNWTFRKAWSCWLPKDLVEAAAFRCSRCRWHAHSSKIL
jgi:hypothetical protein